MRRALKDKERAKGFAAAAKRFAGFQHAGDVLSPVRAKTTRFVQLDHGTRVNGFPIERFVLVHGPSGQGKTYFTLGIEDSFLDHGDFAFHIDAERTTPIKWARSVMRNANSERFFASRPATYEETVKEVRKFLLALKAARDAGEVPPETCAVVVVDSLRKLVPSGIMAKILKDSKDAKGIDGMGGRAAQIKAAMNAAWMDELIPLLEETQAAFIAITRESEDPNADKWAKLAGLDFKVGGGKAPFYDSSLVVRVSRAGWVSEKKGEDEDAEKAKAIVYGERHCMMIRKSKLEVQEDRMTRCYFHTSNGVLVPQGFDRARDVLELAEKFDIVGTGGKGGGWLTWQRHRWQGRHAAVRKLTASPDVLLELETQVRTRFEDNEPEEVKS
jgi:RecA/RadA recombinase